MYTYEPGKPQYDNAYRLAERRVRAKIGFYWHLASYLIVNGMFLAIYLLSAIAADGLYYPWFIWIMIPWGVGLMFNFLSVFVFGEASSSLKQRLMEDEMRKMGGATYSTTAWDKDFK